MVLSGEHAALDEALARLAVGGVAHRAIHMPYAVHSPGMRALMPEVARALAGIAPRLPSVPLFSTVTGGPSGALDGAHWARNIGEPARFADAVDAILARGACTFVEIGPHPTLGAAIAQNAAQAGVECDALPIAAAASARARRAARDGGGALHARPRGGALRGRSAGRRAPRAGVRRRA